MEIRTLRFMRYNICILLVAIPFTFTHSLFSQTIVNTEKLASQAEKGYNAGLEFNFDVEQGNSDLIELDGKTLLGYGNDRHLINFMTGLRYLSENENELIYRNFIHLRHNFYFTKTIRSFSFYQLQRNNSLLMKRRQLIGIGVRKVARIIDSLKIDMGSGIMYEMEKLNQPDTVNNEKANQTGYRMANIISLVYQTQSHISILNTIYLQPNLQDFADFRFFNELSISFSINKYLKLNVSSVWRHDSRPPLNLKRNDFNIQTGIVIKFHMSD